MAPPRLLPPRLRIWVGTVFLLTCGALAAWQVTRTGAAPAVVVAMVVAGGYVAYATWRSGGGYALDALGSRPAPDDAFLEVRSTLADICTRAAIATPTLEVAPMRTPGVVVGRHDGAGVIAIDPRLPAVIDGPALAGVLAHELGHLRRDDLVTTAIRKYLPVTSGFAVFWTLVLAGEGTLIASLGTWAFFGTLFPANRWIRRLRYALGLGVEPALLVVDRWAGRGTEYRADRFAAGLTSPSALTDGLCRMAAHATGTSMDDLTGPQPFTVDRSRGFTLWATHPSIEDRLAYVGAEFPEWVDPAGHAALGD